MLREKQKVEELLIARVPMQECWGGAICSSDEVVVMTMEQRDCVRRFIFEIQLERGGYFERNKTIYHFERSGDECF